jgi:hypothetical protein
MIGAPSASASCSSSSVAPRAPWPARMAILRPLVRTSAARRRSSCAGSPAPRGSLASVLLLQVHREVDVGHALVRERGAAREVRDVLDVRGSHDAGRVDAHVLEHPIEIDILLGVCVDQVVEMMPGDGDDGLPVHLGVVEAVQGWIPPGPEVARHTPSLPVYFA